MTSTIWALAGNAAAPRRKRLAAAAFVGCREPVRSALTFLKRDISVREADPNEEGDDPGNGFELADFDIVVGCSCPRGDQQLFHAVVRDGAHDPDPVIARALLMRRPLAQDFGIIAAFHEFAESSLSDHIRCFYFPVHDCDHTSLLLRRMTACPPWTSRTYESILMKRKIYYCGSNVVFTVGLFGPRVLLCCLL